MPPVSKGEINRRGNYLAGLHRLLRDDVDEFWRVFSKEEYDQAVATVDAYRAAHQKPLSVTSVGVRQFVRTSVGTAPVVSQRLKRLPRIVRKLAIMDNSQLARLEDIGGTRAVVADLDAQRRLCDHIGQVWSSRIVRGPRNYVENPKPTGYRAVHYVVEKYERRIEIQVRTERQQAWANAVENADSRHTLTLKDGTGPTSMLDYFETVGAMLYHADAATTPPSDLKDRLEAARDAVIAEGFYTRRKG